jgi:selenocysteine-specific elongation factor
MSDKEHVIIGTAGHIDHGKSALVKALTGTDPDTLPEEKARGLTIELGFVFLETPGFEKQVVFIDVPGHEKFVRTMVAGASHVDAVLLVIAADEGVSVQTREHFDILRLLGIETGLVALTKCDLVTPARLEEATREAADFVRGSFLEGQPIIPVSALTGAGLEALRAALLDIGRRVKPRQDCGYFRLPIDRVFSIRGFGTVIAGTVLSGEVRAGDTVEILPDGFEARVRGLQVHNAAADLSGIGRRTALNLPDVQKDRLRRGQTAARPGFLAPATRIDARLRLLEQAPVELKTRDRLRLDLGTDEVIARVILLDRDKLRSGESALAQFVLESPTAALYRDRFIVRTFSPLFTVGGGEVLDVAPARHKRLDPDALEAVRRLEGSLPEVVDQTFRNSAPRSRTASEISLTLGLGARRVADAVSGLVSAGRLVSIPGDKEERAVPVDSWNALKTRIVSAVRKYQERNPHRSEMPRADLKSQLLGGADQWTFRQAVEALIGEHSLAAGESGGLTIPGHESRLGDEEQAAADRIEAIFRKAGFEPKPEEDVCRELRLPLNQFRKLMGLLVKQGRLVRLDPKITYHRDNLARARSAVLELIRRNGSVTIAQLKDALETSRKYACALLEHFDAAGLTVRRGDVHVKKP